MESPRLDKKIVPKYTSTELSIENLRPQVLQQTLRQISSLRTEASGRCCVICLDDLTDQCEAQPCRHNNFDHLCLITWLQQRAVCPLCNSGVSEVRYDLSEDGRQGKVYKVPKSSARFETSDGQAEPGSSTSTSLSAHRSNGGSSHLARAQLPYRDEAIQRRRLVYRHNLYSLHIGSNKRQPPASAYRELCPQLIQSDPGLISRARKWLRRELQVFEFLKTSGDLPHSNAEILLEFVIAILRNMDTQGSAGQAEDMIQEFVGRKNARLLLHELKNWLRSPYESLQAWDCNVQYRTGNVPPSISQNIEGESAEGSNIALKYNEPAEARKPPPSQAWKMYIFKGDDILETIELWERSVWLLGRDERVVDLVTSHPSCSGQHAALQFRDTVQGHAKKERPGQMEDKNKTCVILCIIDLLSTHRTSLNGKFIEGNRYVELRHKDIVRFGGSKQEYVIILPPN